MWYFCHYHKLLKDNQIKPHCTDELFIIIRVETHLMCACLVFTFHIYADNRCTSKICTHLISTFLRSCWDKNQTLAVCSHLSYTWALSLMMSLPWRRLKRTPHCLPSTPWLIWSLVCLSLPYLWAQARSTSAMVFGAFRDRIRGPPLSLITTSSSILTPRPRKRFGAWSLSSPMYNPGSIVMAIPG